MSLRQAVRSLVVAVSIGFWAGNSDCGAQGTADPPSSRLGRICTELSRAFSDVRDIEKSLRGGDVYVGANVSTGAQESATLCNSVVDLLRIYEMLSAGRERDEVAWYIRERLSRNAATIASGVKFMNGNSAQAAAPGLALAAERIRDKIRVMGDLFVELAPK